MANRHITTIKTAETWIMESKDLLYTKWKRKCTALSRSMSWLTQGYDKVSLENQCLLLDEMPQAVGNTAQPEMTKALVKQNVGT